MRSLPRADAALVVLTGGTQEMYRWEPAVRADAPAPQ
jgi:hypothetical protein